MCIPFTVQADLGTNNTLMKTQTTDSAAMAQASQALKTWTAPKLERLSIAMDTLTMDASGLADGGVSSTAKT